MPCSDYLELISAHIDNEISAADERRLQAHLAVCSDCRALLDFFVQADSGLASLAVDAPEGLKDAVMKNLPAQAKKERHIGRYLGLGLAAAAAIALAIGFSSKLPSLNTKKSADRSLSSKQAPQEANELYNDSQNLSIPLPEQREDTDTASLAPYEAAPEQSTKRHRDHMLDAANAQSVAVLENTDKRTLPELDGFMPTACFSDVDDFSEICTVPLPDAFEDGLCFVNVYEIDRETFLSIIEAYEGELPLTYDDSFQSPTVCLYVIFPAE